ncbi:MAG: hypothetical protein ISF22_04925 [Methanomassiliicoccus sp.]|nr:hypothetical protein [Methanomassiliicoccus sp.]
MSYNHNARVVTYSFPDLAYKNTLSIRSDPEIVVFHDRNSTASGLMIYIIPMVVASAMVVGVLFVRRRRKAGSG